MDAAIITIGDEILTGRTLDYNSHWIAKRITGLGFNVKLKLSVQDNINEIVDALNYSKNKGVELIITTGGLGPTLGDVTFEAVAKFADKRLVLDKRALEMVKERYLTLYQLGFVESPEITKSREKMAKIPEGSIPFYNPIGVAPGILLHLDSLKIISLPGVPSEMMYLLEMILPLLGSGGGVTRIRETTVLEGDESKLSRIFEKIMKEIPQVYLKSYPLGFGEVVKMRVIGIAKGSNIEEAERYLNQAFELLEMYFIRNKEKKKGFSSD